MGDLYKTESKVIDEASFVEFVNALSADWEDEQCKERIRPNSPYGSGANGWENGSIGAFLSAAAAWAQSSAGREDIGASKNPWQRAAEILHAGKYCE